MLLTEAAGDIVLCALITGALEEFICWRNFDKFTRATI